MKSLLTLTTLFELPTGLALLALPSLFASLVLGLPLDAPVALVIARVAGAALLSLCIVCWIARNDAGSSTARSLVVALSLYNVLVAALLAHARIGYGLSGVALWPAVLFHVVLAAWCVKCLQNNGNGPALDAGPRQG